MQRMVACIAIGLTAIAIVACATSTASHGDGREISGTTEAALSHFGSGWTDRSPHREGFLEVRGARLAYLDWGGRPDAPVLILIPGSGQSAHIFDDLAPRFTDRFHVLGFTRRGISPSTVSDSGYTLAALTADLVGELDALHIARATFAGHSIAGGEITWLAAAHPDRVEKLVYLDAIYDYATRFRDTSIAYPVSQPAPPTDTAMATWRTWLAQVHYGYWSDPQEADIRQGGDRRGMDVELKDLVANPSPYDRVHAPSLMIVTVPTVHTAFPWLDPVRDSASVRAASNYVTQAMRPAMERDIQNVLRQMPSARIVRLESPHHVFIARQDDVVAAMRAFLDR